MQRGFATDLRGVFAGVFVPVLCGFLCLNFGVWRGVALA
jgi:hypothetical protein